MEEEMEEESEFLTAEEVCEELGISLTQLYEITMSGMLKPYNKKGNPINIRNINNNGRNDFYVRKRL